MDYNYKALISSFVTNRIHPNVIIYETRQRIEIEQIQSQTHQPSEELISCGLHCNRKFKYLYTRNILSPIQSYRHQLMEQMEQMEHLYHPY